jgi:drug/metabolite transporter (DMT)-like permease
VGAVFLALAAASLWGTASFLGGLASRHGPLLTVTTTFQLVAFLVLSPFLIAHPARLTPQAWEWGALGGLGGTLGLSFLLYAFTRDMVSVVSPIFAVATATMPVAAGLTLGERPSLAAGVGVACGLLAVALMGLNRIERLGLRRLLIHVALALTAGAGTSFYNISLALAPKSSGFWPLAISQLASIGLMATVLFATRHTQLRIRPFPVITASAAGTCSMLAAICYLSAVRQEQLVLVAVLVSLSPGITIVLSCALMGERLRPWQLAGIALALMSLSLIALGL